MELNYSSTSQIAIVRSEELVFGHPCNLSMENKFTRPAWLDNLSKDRKKSGALTCDGMCEMGSEGRECDQLN